MHIIKATLEHLDALVPLFEAYRAFYKQAPNPERAREFLGSLIEKNLSVVFLGVEDPKDTSEAAGFAQLYPFRSSIVMLDYWVLNHLYVSEKYRRHGAGRLLLEKCIEFAREDGAPKLVLETGHDNYPARALYDAYGFKPDRDNFMYTKWL